MRVALSVMLRILSFLPIEPGKQPFDQLNRRLRNRYVSVLPHADRGARYPHDLGEDRLGKFEPTPDGHKEGRFHVTLPLRATTTPWADWPLFRWRRLAQGGLFVCVAHVRSAPKRKGAIACSRVVRGANRLRLQLTGLEACPLRLTEEQNFLNYTTLTGFCQENLAWSGGPCRDRTCGPLIKSQLLYQLS